MNTCQKELADKHSSIQRFHRSIQRTAQEGDQAEPLGQQTPQFMNQTPLPFGFSDGRYWQMLCLGAWRCFWARKCTVQLTIFAALRGSSQSQLNPSQSPAAPPLHTSLTVTKQGSVKSPHERALILYLQTRWSQTNLFHQLHESSLVFSSVVYTVITKVRVTQINTCHKYMYK